MKKKNLMTLTVDGKSNLNIMKKSKKLETVTKDPIYIGGVPKSVVNKGLQTRGKQLLKGEIKADAPLMKQSSQLFMDSYL